MTEKWSARSDFTVYLTNSATLTSLFLGISAIFYSYISNQAISSGLGQIVGVEREIGEAKKEIILFVEGASGANKLLLDSKISLERTSDFIKSDLEGLRDLLASVRDENAILKDNVSLLPDKIDQVESRLFSAIEKQALTSARSHATGMPDAETNSFADQLIQRSSFQLCLAILSIVLYSKSLFRFKIEQLSETVSMPPPMMFSHIAFLASIGLIDVDFDNASKEGIRNAIVRVTVLSSALADLDESVCSQKASEIDDDKSREEAEKELSRLISTFSS